MGSSRPTDERALGSSYIIETRIGRGEIGEVWRGRVRDSNEPVAAKFLHVELASDPEVVARFIRERSSLMAVEDPNVVTVRDLVVEGETLAVVTDLVDGPSLRTLLDTSGPLPRDDALAIIEQVLRGSRGNPLCTASSTAT